MHATSLSSAPVSIHPTAIVEPGAQLAAGVVIGAYAYIGPQVRLGPASVVQHHATVEGNTSLGAENTVYPYACLGGRSHDLKFKGGNPGLQIGDRNVFREYVTVHAATQDGTLTRMGDDNFLLAYSHVAHDCQVGNQVIISSHAALGGHVTLADKANIGWSSGIHQHCRIGYCAMIGACSKVVQDVPPFMTADGNPASVRTINKIGLERAGFSSAQIELVRSLFKHFYQKGYTRSEAVAALAAHPQADSWIVQNILQFSKNSTRGWA